MFTACVHAYICVKLLMIISYVSCKPKKKALDSVFFVYGAVRVRTRGLMIIFL